MSSRNRKWVCAFKNLGTLVAQQVKYVVELGFSNEIDKIEKFPTNGLFIRLYTNFYFPLNFMRSRERQIFPSFKSPIKLIFYHPGDMIIKLIHQSINKVMWRIIRSYILFACICKVRSSNNSRSVTDEDLNQTLKRYPI